MSNIVIVYFTYVIFVNKKTFSILFCPVFLLFVNLKKVGIHMSFFFTIRETYIID